MKRKPYSPTTTSAHEMYKSIGLHNHQRPMRCNNLHNRGPRESDSQRKKKKKKKKKGLSFRMVSDDDRRDLRLPCFSSSPNKITAGRQRSFTGKPEGGGELDGLQSPAPLSDFGGDCEYHDRMDMLWEDFNDELHRISQGMKREKAPNQKSNHVDEADHVEHEACWDPVAAAATPEREAVLRRRKPGLAKMLKVLKSLFVVQKLQLTRKAWRKNAKEIAV